MENTVIRLLSIYGDSLKKLYKILPENCIKTSPNTISDVLDLEVNINGIIFTGKEDKSYIVINSSGENYTEEDLTAFQKIAIKCFTYPFGALGFTFSLNLYSNDKTENTIKALLDKYKLEPVSENSDSEGRIKLKICNVKDYTTPSFINFILELQTLTHLLEE